MNVPVLKSYAESICPHRGKTFGKTITGSFNSGNDKYKCEYAQGYYDNGDGCTKSITLYILPGKR